MKQQRLTSEQAFRAMSLFLEQYYARSGQAAELGAVLGDIQLNADDGRPYDPAAWSDWLAAIGAALEEPKPTDAVTNECLAISQRRKHR